MKEYVEKAAVISIIKTAGFWEKEDSEVAITCVNQTPAAEVVEVRRGYWIDHHSGGSFCSACKRWVPYSHHPKYCETCGARMDGKEDEHEAD